MVRHGSTPVCGLQAHFHLEMALLANLGVNLHVCLCGKQWIASLQTLDFLGIGQAGTNRKPEAVEKIPISG